MTILSIYLHTYRTNPLKSISKWLSHRQTPTIKKERSLSSLVCKNPNLYRRNYPTPTIQPQSPKLISPPRLRRNNLPTRHRPCPSRQPGLRRSLPQQTRRTIQNRRTILPRHLRRHVGIPHHPLRRRLRHNGKEPRNGPWLPRIPPILRPRGFPLQRDQRRPKARPTAHVGSLPRRERGMLIIIFNLPTNQYPQNTSIEIN